MNLECSYSQNCDKHMHKNDGLICWDYIKNRYTLWDKKIILLKMDDFEWGWVWGTINSVFFNKRTS